MRSLLLAILVFSVCLTNCRKNAYDPQPKEIGQNFLPLKVGKELIYQSDSIKYGFNGSSVNGDTIHFFIKEVIIDKIEDSSKTTFVLSRYHGIDTTHWVFVKNHFYEVEKFRINHKDNGLLKTNLVFPILPYYYWNGNQLNSLGPHEYEYSMINFKLNKPNKSYENCIKVKIDSINNLRERKITSEIFSQNVGLVYTENINVSLINNDSLDKDGNVIFQRPPKIEKGIIFTKLLLR